MAVGAHAAALYEALAETPELPDYNLTGAEDALENGSALGPYNFDLMRRLEIHASDNKLKPRDALVGRATRSIP